MRYGLALEEINTRLWIAWNLDLPGCVSMAVTRDEVVALAPDQIAAHLDWLAGHGDGLGPLFAAAFEVEVEETFRPRSREGMSGSIAFFEADRVPLKGEEIEQGLRQLHYARTDLMALVRHLPTETLEQPIDEDTFGSVANVLEHLAWAEWWYCDRLGITLEREQIPADPVTKLDVIRGWLRSRLREMAGQRLVVDQVGETWSPRKLLRRALWHEREHTAHIARLLSGETDIPGSGVEL
jgi:hypothetical protein